MEMMERTGLKLKNLDLLDSPKNKYNIDEF